MSEGKVHTPVVRHAQAQTGIVSPGNASSGNASSEPNSVPHTIALVCPRNDKASASVSDPFLLSLVGQVGDVLSKCNCELLISAFPRGFHDWKARFLDSGRAQGIIVFGHGTFPESINHLVDTNSPFVVWGSTSGFNKYCTVGSDNQRGGYLATCHLLEAGRRRIAFLGDYTLPEITERYLGYRKALSEYSVPQDESLVIKTHPEAYSTFDSIYNHLVEKSVEFDGIVASTDVIGIEAITVLHKLGVSVPDDVSIVGFDDIPVAAANSPALSTVSQDINFAAREIVARLFQLIKTEKVKSLRLPVKLIERASSKPPRQTHGVITVNTVGRIEFIDSNCEKIIEYKIEELVGQPLSFLFPDPALFPEAVLEEFNWSEFANKKNHGVQKFFHLENKQGQLVAVHMALTSDLTNSDGHMTCVLWNAGESNASDLPQYAESVEQAVAQRTQQLTLVAQKMEKLAFEDALTGVANRRQFDKVLKEAMTKAKDEDSALALAIFDVDFFKSYNDNYGHLAGDTCLKSVARVIHDAFDPKYELTARYGGEEFAVIMPGAEISEAVAAVEKALQAIRDQKIQHEYSMVADYVTLSCGVYSCRPPPTMRPENLIWMADKALYEAKGGGRNRMYVEPEDGQAVYKGD